MYPFAAGKEQQCSQRNFAAGGSCSRPGGWVRGTGGEAFWCGPRAETESAAAGEDRPSARASPWRPGLAGCFPPQPQLRLPPPQTSSRRAQRNARSFGPARSGAARIRGTGGESPYGPLTPCRGRWGPATMGTRLGPPACRSLGQPATSGGLGLGGAESDLENSSDWRLDGGLGIHPGLQ